MPSTATQRGALSANSFLPDAPDDFSLLLDCLPLPVMAVSADGAVRFCNQAMRARGIGGPSLRRSGPGASSFAGTQPPREEQAFPEPDFRADEKKEDAASGMDLRTHFPAYAFLIPSLRTAFAKNLPVVHENVLLQNRLLTACYTVTITPVLMSDGFVALVSFQEVAVAHQAIEDMLAQVQRSTFVSGFAAGMAHEVNSPLSVVFQGTQNILRRLDPALEQNRRIAAELGCDLEIVERYLKKRGILKTIETVRQSAERATAIIANMLGFSRQRESKRTTVHIRELVTRCLELVRLDAAVKNAIQTDLIDIEHEYEPYLPLIICHPTEIEQVLLNLIKNAVQAMHANPPGRHRLLRIDCRSENKMLRIDVADTGPGIDDSKRRQVFEPFITTKTVGSGTGLGLFISRHIIEGHHHGRIEVSSSPGNGATFSIFLPFAPE